METILIISLAVIIIIGSAVADYKFDRKYSKLDHRLKEHNNARNK